MATDTAISAGWAFSVSWSVSAWTQIRRLNPDWIVSWSLSNMHVIASREMKRNGISIEKYIAV
ncbi:MAG: hypothetical protein JSV48_15030, partial [Bradyrhizobium sp.]